MDIFTVINKFKRLNFRKEIVKILNSKRIKDLIIKMEQDRLFELGEDSEGESLGEYSALTIEIKTEKGQRTDHITLNDTGDFYKSFTVQSTESEITFDADAQKEDTDLFAELGFDILGLNEVDTEILQEQVLIELNKIVLSKLL